MNERNLPHDVHMQPRGGWLNEMKQKVFEVAGGSQLPTKTALGYDSTVLFFGSKLNMIAGKMVHDFRGMVSFADQKGDVFLRKLDDHITQRPLDIIRRHPGWLFKLVLGGPKRHRGTQKQILAHIKELRLEDLYGPHESGIEVKKPHVYNTARPLQDIYRADLIEDADELLKQAQESRFDALARVTEYIKELHAFSAVGELVPSKILFQDIQNRQAIRPTLTIPDIVFNKKKPLTENEKRAIDLIDFFVSTSVEEMRLTGKAGLAESRVPEAIETIITNYSTNLESIEVMKLVASFLKRGRLTLFGDKTIYKDNVQSMLAIHNTTRLRVEKDFAIPLKTLIVKSIQDKIRPRYIA